MFGIQNLFGKKTDLKPIIENGAIILDVRTVEEYRTGHIKGSVNMPLNALNLEVVRKYNKPVVTCCASGMRSGVAANQLKAAGIETYNGGAWESIERLVE